MSFCIRIITYYRRTHVKKALIFLSLSFFLFGFGCASHRHIIQKELSKEAAKYVRKKTDELLLKKGPPDLKGILSTGEQLWTYCSTKAGEQKSLTMTIGNAPSNTNIKTWRENVNFVISPEGVFRSYSVSVD